MTNARATRFFCLRRLPDGSALLLSEVEERRILIQIAEPDNKSRIIAGRTSALNTRQMSKKNANKTASNVIAVNRRARFDYFIEDTFEAGLSLEGWEAKSLRNGGAQLTESYVNVHKGEAWLQGAHFAPPKTTSTHVKANPTRTRKLLLHRLELDRLIGQVERKGYSLVPLDLHWIKGRAKLTIGLAKGKKQHDKRAASKDADWQRQKARILKG
jgi:SsrA-binding protein